MKYGPEFHRRRSIRLSGYDYSRPGAYFVTVCTQNRDLLLESEAVQEVVRSAWQGLARRFPRVAPDEFVIMPNHIHGVIVLRGAACCAPTLGKVVRAFKSISGIEANRVLNRLRLPFWQHNYYEHVIRDEEELKRIRQYIRDNPFNWSDDPDNPSNL